MAEHLKITPQATHRQLKNLVERGDLVRVGTPPYTVYILAPQKSDQHPKLSPLLLVPVEARFSYLSPRGSLFFGEAAFYEWLTSKNLLKDAESLARAYEKLTQDIYDVGSDSPFPTTQRLAKILKDFDLDSAVISDYYALPEFGKTILGNLVHVCKTFPASDLLESLFKRIREDVHKLIQELKIDTVCWVPHSLKRAKPFLPSLKKKFALSLPEIKVKKIFAGSIPVPQKSLSKLEDRIENARTTLFLEPVIHKPKNILVIDDAIGSGATINELSKIIRQSLSPHSVHAYAIVGSYKGIDVITQV